MSVPLASGLYEIRAKDKEGIGRSMYCVAKEKENSHNKTLQIT